MARAAQAARKHAHPETHLSTYSFSELSDLKFDIESEIRSRQAAEIEELRAKVAGTARALGMSVEDIMGLKHNGRRATKHPRGPQPRKYRGPAGEEWSGRGPNPRWMKPLLEKGKTKADFLIK